MLSHTHMTVGQRSGNNQKNDAMGLEAWNKDRQSEWERGRRKEKNGQTCSLHVKLLIYMPPLLAQCSAAGRIVPNTNGLWLFPGNSAIWTCADVNSSTKHEDSTRRRGEGEGEVSHHAPLRWGQMRRGWLLRDAQRPRGDEVLQSRLRHFWKSSTLGEGKNMPSLSLSLCLFPAQMCPLCTLCSLLSL